MRGAGEGDGGGGGAGRGGGEGEGRGVGGVGGVGGGVGRGAGGGGAGLGWRGRGRGAGGWDGAGGRVAWVQGKCQPWGMGKPVGTSTGGAVPAKAQLSPAAGRPYPRSCRLPCPPPYRLPCPPPYRLPCRPWTATRPPAAAGSPALAEAAAANSATTPVSRTAATAARQPACLTVGRPGLCRGAWCRCGGAASSIWHTARACAAGERLSRHRAPVRPNRGSVGFPRSPAERMCGGLGRAGLGRGRREGAWRGPEEEGGAWRGPGGLWCGLGEEGGPSCELGEGRVVTRR